MRGAGNTGPFDWDTFGVNYAAAGADVNKTTMAAADPEKAVDFVVRYLGAARLQQVRGPPADGQCATLAWAEWPDGHQWHTVLTPMADWSDGVNVPYNVTQLAAYIEGIRDLRSGHIYDQWLDDRDVFDIANLTAAAELFRRGDVDFAVWSRPDEEMCSIIADIPGNGLAVELRSKEFGGEWLQAECAAHPWDLCAEGSLESSVVTV